MFLLLVLLTGPVVCSQAIAKIAGIEIPNKEWVDIIPMLLGHAANPALPVGPMQAILMTISYLLDEIVCGCLLHLAPLCVTVALC
jgi:hypothetical protein